jgi:hypothetical protein
MGPRAGRLVQLIAAAAAVAVALVPAGSAGLRNTANPTLYFTYAMNCTFVILDDSGKPVTSIPPGHYQVDVRTPVVFGMYPMTEGQTDFYACRGVPQFQLTGPGINIFTTMTAGCEQEKLFTATLAPNATYVAQDLNQPSLTRDAFTTLASGSSTPVAVTYGGGKGKVQQSEDLVGSGTINGTLHASVSPQGKLVLLHGGKPISKLAAGRYKFMILDEDSKAGFVVLGPDDTAPTSLTPSAFKGTKSVTLRLTPGKWSYYATLATVHFFRVT